MPSSSASDRQAAAAMFRLEVICGLNDVLVFIRDLDEICGRRCRELAEEQISNAHDQGEEAHEKNGGNDQNSLCESLHG